MRICTVCKRMTRTRSQLPTPGAVMYQARGMCSACYEIDRSKSGKRARRRVMPTFKKPAPRVESPSTPEEVQRMTGGTAAWLLERRKRIARRQAMRAAS